MEIWTYTTCDECGKLVEISVMFAGRQFGHGGVIATICLNCLNSAKQMLAEQVLVAETEKETVVKNTSED